MLEINHLENEELQEFPGTFAEYNQAMLETKINMKKSIMVLVLVQVKEY